MKTYTKKRKEEFKNKDIEMDPNGIKKFKYNEKTGCFRVTYNNGRIDPKVSANYGDLYNRLMEQYDIIKKAYWREYQINSILND